MGVRPLPVLGTVLAAAVVCAPVLEASAGPAPDGAQAAPLESPEPIRIVALGDSLTSGHRLPREQAYPAVLEASIREAGIPVKVINHGVSGDTSAGGLRRLEAALRERPQILIVALGANDGLRGVPVSQVRANLDRIVRTALERGTKVLLVGMEALPIHGLQYTFDFHNVFPELAAEHDVPLVPFMLSGVFGNPDLMTRDNIHPNAEGARVIASTIWTYLRPLLESLQP